MTTRAATFLFVIVSGFCLFGDDAGPGPFTSSTAAYMFEAIAAVQPALSSPAEDPASPGVGIWPDARKARIAMKGAQLVLPLVGGLLMTGLCLLGIFRASRWASRPWRPWRLLVGALPVSIGGAAVTVAGFAWYASRQQPTWEHITVAAYGEDSMTGKRLLWARVTQTGRAEITPGPAWPGTDIWVRDGGTRATPFRRVDALALRRQRLPSLAGLDLICRTETAGGSVPFEGEVVVAHDGTSAGGTVRYRGSTPPQWSLVFRRVGGHLVRVETAGHTTRSSNLKLAGAITSCARLAQALYPSAEAVIVARAGESNRTGSLLLVQALPVRLRFPMRRTVSFRKTGEPRPLSGPAVPPPVFAPVRLRGGAVLVDLSCDAQLVPRATERACRAEMDLVLRWVPHASMDGNATVTVALRDDTGQWQPIAAFFHKPVAGMARQELQREISAYRTTRGEGIVQAYRKTLLQPESLADPGDQHLQCRVTHDGDGPPVEISDITLTLELEVKNTGQAQ